MNENDTPMYQRTIDFEKPAAAEPEHVALSTSLPPPPEVAKAPPLVRPDRQIVYPEASNHFEWPDPKPLYDRDTITVDRISADIDGPSHRFVIRRGDQVEVFISRDNVDLGEVTGISHAREEVEVTFREGTGGVWFAKGQIYPAPEDTPQRPHPRGKALSAIIAEVNADHAPEGGFTEADKVPTRPSLAPYKLAEHSSFREALQRGTLTIEFLKESFERLLASRDAIVTELKTLHDAKRLKLLAARMGSFHAKQNTKEQNAQEIYERLLQSFHLGDGFVWQPMQETLEHAIATRVRAQTQGDIDRYAETTSQARSEREKSLTNPETREEFLALIRARGEKELSDAQLEAFDRLEADRTRQARALKTTDTVTRFESDEITSASFRLITGFHDRRQATLFIVQLTERVERETYNELNRKAKMLGGWYSSFKRDQAGFHFFEEDKAQRFIALLAGDENRSDVLAERKTRREQTAAERLHELADELAHRADETIERSEAALTNTARRAEMQAGVRGRAFADQALARTLHSIAEALSTGEAKYLDGLRHKTQVETLDTLLRLARWARIRSMKREEGESSYAHSRRTDQETERALGEHDIRFVEYPFPSIYKRHLEDAVHRGVNVSGAKLASERMRKRLRGEGDYLLFRDAHDIEALEDFLGRVKSAGIDVQWIERSLEHHTRLERAGIRTIHELRSALREYLPHRAETRGEDPIRVAERELIGRKLPGFFPTPRPVINQMLEYAGIEATHRVLEPSCGKGDILDSLRDSHPEATRHAIELNRTLADVLSAKGHDVEFGDFLTHQAVYDRIVMNPPFEDGQDIDHVRHAFDLLSPGGRVVSVMCEGPFFRSDAKSQAFRDWFQELGGESYELPADAFQGAEAFRATGVRTRLVVLDKP